MLLTFPSPFIYAGSPVHEMVLPVESNPLPVTPQTDRVASFTDDSW